MLLDLRPVPDRMRLLHQTFKELLSSLEEVLSEIGLASLTLIFCKMLPQALSVRDFLADFTRHLTLTSPELPELDWCLVEILHNNVLFPHELLVCLDVSHCKLLSFELLNFSFEL